MTYDFLESEQAFANFIDQFQQGTLPKPIWTHGAHLAVGTWYLVNFPEEIAIWRVRTGIQHYNRCLGNANTPEPGSFARGAWVLPPDTLELPAGRGSERVSRIGRIVSDVLSKLGNKSTLRDI